MYTTVTPDLSRWLPDPALRIVHRRESTAPPELLWQSAREITLRDAALLGRLIRWRIPGTATNLQFDQLFRQPPFTVLEEHDAALVSGIVGRIWTLRRDYPRLDGPEEFRAWSSRGTAKVLFAHWVVAAGSGGSVLTSESRVVPLGTQGRIGVLALRPLVARFQHLIGSDGIEAAVRRAQQR